MFSSRPRTGDATPGPAIHPAVWRAADLGHVEELVYELTPDDVAILANALAALKQRGLAYTDTDRDTISLGRLDDTLHDLYREVRDGAGFVMLRGLPVSRLSKDDVRLVSWLVACRFGLPVSQNAAGARIADVMDLIKGASSPRGYHSNAELRLHTDPASDLIGLCCIEAAKEGGDSRLANAVAVHDEIRATRPDLLDVLYEGFHYSRFGEGLPDDPEVTDYKVPVLSVIDSAVSCRYGSNRIRGALKALGTEMSDKEKEALAYFAETAADPRFAISFRMQPGDFLIANNLTLLHARTDFVDNDDPDRPRHLLRFWLEGHDFRKVRPELNFFNRGRCGIVPREQHA